MQPNNNLPPGFISIDDAVELIKSDSRENPVVDMDYIVSRSHWIEVNHNFRIPKIVRLPADKVYRTKRGKVVEYEHVGDANVSINTTFEKELLKKTIYDKYRELVGREYRDKGVKAVSTVADDAQGRDAVKPRANKPIAKEGTSLGDHGVSTTNGEGISV